VFRDAGGEVRELETIALEGDAGAVFRGTARVGINA
jgi:hypothetical protein